MLLLSRSRTWPLGAPPPDYVVGHVRAVLPDRVLDDARIVVREGRIAEVGAHPAGSGADVDGALLSAIGIAGMDRLVQRNVLAMSGRAVEAAGDVTTLLLDKTGTITYGNRRASDFVGMPGVADDELAGRREGVGQQPGEGGDARRGSAGEHQGPGRRPGG